MPGAKQGLKDFQTIYHHSLQVEFIAFRPLTDWTMNKKERKSAEHADVTTNAWMLPP